MEKFYVTYQFKYDNHPYIGGTTIEKWAVECNTMEEAQEVAAERNSLVGIKYLRINKCGRLPKGTKIMYYDVYSKL